MPGLDALKIEAQSRMADFSILELLDVTSGLASSQTLDDGFLAASRRQVSELARVTDEEHATDAWRLSGHTSATRRLRPDGFRPSSSSLAQVMPHICRETDDLFVLSKPPGWSSVRGGRAQCQLLSVADFLKHAAREFPIGTDPAVDYGLTQRLDIPTSGALLAAKTYQGFWRARLEFCAQEVRKSYLGLCEGHFPKGSWVVIDAPLRLLRKPIGAGSVRSEAVVCNDGLRARTLAKALSWFSSSDGRFSLVAARPVTGRTHQIRCHLSHLGHPLVADEQYGGTVLDWCRQPRLHCAGFQLQDADGRLQSFDVDPPPDLLAALEHLTTTSGDRASTRAHAMEEAARL